MLSSLKSNHNKTGLTHYCTLRVHGLILHLVG